MTTPAGTSAAPARLAPLYMAGFVTAFGAHSVAAGIGADRTNLGLGLFALGVFLAVYDLAEIVLKPVFGTLSDRIGPKPVIVAGLTGFALVSLLGVWAVGPVELAVIRFLQGAAASAFSPASSASVSRLTDKSKAGTYFGRYGSWKGLGYAFGPIAAAVLLGTAGTPLLFGVLAGIATLSAVWVAIAVPPIPPLPRTRYTLVDLTKQVTDRSFLLPTIALAATTAVLGAATGLLPALGRSLGLNIYGATAAVTVLAIASALCQPLVGKLRDSGRLTTSPGISLGLGLLTSGLLVAALIPHPVAVFVAALVLGTGIGVVTPLAFSHLSATTPPQRIGRTMGTAEIGREAGDAAGPLLVGSIGSALGLPVGLVALAALALTAGALSLRLNPVRRTD